MTKRVICVDWGSTNFRAHLFERGAPAGHREVPGAGIARLEARAFEDILFAHIADWLDTPATVVLSGMITSRNGWVEVPYISRLSGPAELLAGAITREAPGVTLLFLPGLMQTDPVPDVMRGEEVQILGALADEEHCTVVLPGTHSKWVRCGPDGVETFRTFMSGELHHLILRQSLAGRLAVEDGDRQAAFLRGLGAARDAPIAALFAARSSVLLGRMAPEDVGDYLSGVLIGAEIAEAQRLGLVGSRVRLAGEAALLGRYKAACEVMLPDRVAEVVPMAATAGFRRIVHALDRVAAHPVG